MRYRQISSENRRPRPTGPDRPARSDTWVFLLKTALVGMSALFVLWILLDVWAGR